MRIPLADLVRYDDNIREHLRAMNARGPQPGEESAEWHVRAAPAA